MTHRPSWKQGSFDFSATDSHPIDAAPTPPPRVNGQSHASRLKRTGQLRLFDGQPSTAYEAPSAPLWLPTPASAPLSESRPPLVEFSSGQVAKARDVIAAIKTLKLIEQEARPATEEEKQVLARFCGFGPLALHIFPDPMTGAYKDASWERMGHELRDLLTVEEYDSAKRTTFNAFYTSPVVMQAMHNGLARLGLPSSGLVLEPGAGIGRFAAAAPAGMRFIGVELDSLSSRIAKALNPGQDIRNENFRDSKLPPLDGVIGKPRSFTIQTRRTQTSVW